MSLAEDFFAKLSEMAEELGLEDDEKDNFVNSGMKRRGFKQTFTWSDPEPDGNDAGGDFFSKRREGQQRKVGGNGKGANWQYGS